MGHDSASEIEAHTKVTITNLHGLQEPQAFEQSGNFEPATWMVLCFPNSLALGTFLLISLRLVLVFVTISM